MCVILQEVCECVYLCKSSVLNWILKGRMYGLIAYPLRWNMLLNDVVHLSTGYILSIFLSRKENTNKPVKQNKKYKNAEQFFYWKYYDINRQTIFKIVIYTRFWWNVHIILRSTICNTRQENDKRSFYLYSKDSKAVNKDFMYARRRRTIFTSLD